MATAIRNDIDATSFILELKLDRQKLVEDIEKKLKRIQKNVDLKGFRKGQAPMSMVRRIYEEQALAEVSTKAISELLDDYFKTNHIKPVGQPEVIDQETKEAPDTEQIVFSVKVYHSPDFELRMPDKSVVFELPEFTDIEKVAKAELEQLKTAWGKRIDTPEHPHDNAIYELKISEMDENGRELRENGLACETSISLDRVRNEELRNEIRAKKVGDTFICDYHDLDMFETREQSGKYLLGLSDDANAHVNALFRCEVVNYFHVEEQELNADFLSQQFGPEITSEEKALEWFKNALEWSFHRVYRYDRFDMIKRKLIELNHFAYPFEYTRKRLEELRHDSITEDAYRGLCLGIYWEKLQNKIIEEYDIAITEQDLYVAAANQLRNMGIASAEQKEFIGQIQRMLQNEQIKENLWEREVVSKITQIVGELVSIVRKPMTYEEIKTWMNDFEPLMALPPELAPAPAYATSEDESVANNIARYGEMLKQAKDPHPEDGIMGESMADYQDAGKKD